MHQSSYDKMSKFATDFLVGRQDDKLLIYDLGSQDINGSYRPIFDHPSWRYVGVDLDHGENVDLVLGDPYQWREVAGETVDILVSGQAFEHIEYFWLTMAEIARVLKKGGLCCLIAPSRGPEHRYPVDCWRFYPDGFRALARYAGLEVLSVTTQWDSLDYMDCSNNWGDTMLVARKTAGSLKKKDSFGLLSRAKLALARLKRLSI